MATMNVSLPDAMKDWVENQARSGKYSNSSDFVRDLIRRDQMRQVKIAYMQSLVDEALKDGEGRRSLSELRAAALAKIEETSAAKSAANDVDET